MTSAIVDRSQAAGRMIAAAKPHIVTILPRGEAIRNFVYSGVLDTVANHANLTVLSVIPSEELRDLLSSSPFSLKPLAIYSDRWPVRFTRDLLDISHGRRLWSNAAQERWMLRDYEASTMPAKLKRFARKSLCYPFANSTGLELLSGFERCLSRALCPTDEYLNLYREIKPDLVFNASHVHSPHAIQAVQAAHWLGIPTATFIFSWDNLTSQGRILPAYEWYIVWNEDIRAQLLRIYRRVRPEQVIVTGTPQFDFHFRHEYAQTRDEFCCSVGADPRRPIVLYTTGMANHMPGEDRIVEGIADILGTIEDRIRPQLLVRVYPKDLTRRFEPLKQRRPDILFPAIPWERAWLTPKVDDLPLLTNMLRHCSIGINIASTISLELCMFNKPTINIGYNPPDVNIDPISFARYYRFDHYSPVVESGAVEVAYSQHELAAMIRRALREPERLAQQRTALIESMFGDTLDGRSADRVARQLLRIGCAHYHGG